MRSGSEARTAILEAVGRVQAGEHLTCERRNNDSEILSVQVKAAREFLGWTQEDPSQIAGIPPATVKRIELSKGALRGTHQNVSRIQKTLEDAGIEFINEDKRIGVILEEENEEGEV